MLTKMLQKAILAVIMCVTLLQVSYAAAGIIDIQIEEFATETTIYNPLQSSSGLYADGGENFSQYSINGEINISNIHPSETAQDILINISGASNIYNISYLNGSNGFVSEYNAGGDYMLLFVPDLAAGASTIFTYDVNTTLIGPPINLTAAYSDSRIFSGLPITVTDSVENNLNATEYSDTCIFNLSVDIYAMSLNNSGSFDNVTLGPVTGGDFANAALHPSQENISWNVLGGGCLNSGASTFIDYTANTPAGIVSAGNYEIVNSTMNYVFNSTFSTLNVTSTDAIVDLDVEFEKYLNQTLSGDNGTWQISALVTNPSNVDVNITQVSHWVSVRDGTGTGFTNPGIFDNDTISGNVLTFNYTPNVLLNSTTGNWNSSGAEWLFNYTISASPIVWMDVDSNIIDDGLQLQDRSVSYGEDLIYVRELYIATGYWLQISRNITRFNDSEYNVDITVVNLGTSPTPANQAVQVYNFIPNEFNLSSSFVFSNSPFYTTASANETLTDPEYNGTMFQFGILGNNAQNVSLDSYGGSVNQNNSWSVSYNVTGDGEFNFEDLFLTGVDPLNVEEVGGSNYITMEGVISLIGAKTEYVLATAAAVLGALVIFM